MGFSREILIFFHVILENGTQGLCMFNPYFNYICVCVCVCVFSHQILFKSFVIPWTVAHWTPLSMGFPRQEYWSGLPFPSPGDLPDPGIEPTAPATSPAL